MKEAETGPGMSAAPYTAKPKAELVFLQGLGEGEVRFGVRFEQTLVLFPEP